MDNKDGPQQSQCSGIGMAAWWYKTATSGLDSPNNSVTATFSHIVLGRSNTGAWTIKMDQMGMAGGKRQPQVV